MFFFFFNYFDIGDPQQTVQIQVMNPNVTALTSQVSMHQPKYQMAHIPLQTFSQGEIGNNNLLNLRWAGE